MKLSTLSTRIENIVEVYKNKSEGARWMLGVYLRISKLIYYLSILKSSWQCLTSRRALGTLGPGRVLEQTP